MASSKLGHIYIIHTVFTKPNPKDKYAVCVSEHDPRWFIWINSEPQKGGMDQLGIPAGCHELIKHDSFMDLSQVRLHQDFELDGAKEKACISQDMCKHMIARIEAGLDMMPPRHQAIVLASLKKLLT